MKNTAPCSGRVDQAALPRRRSFPLWYRAVSKLLRTGLVLESQWSLCFLFSSSPSLIWLHPLGVYVILGPSAHAAFGEGGKKQLLPLGPEGFCWILMSTWFFLSPPSPVQTCWRGTVGLVGWMGAHAGCLLSEELLVTPPLFRSVQ